MHKVIFNVWYGKILKVKILVTYSLIFPQFDVEKNLKFFIKKIKYIHICVKNYTWKCTKLGDVFLLTSWIKKNFLWMEGRVTEMQSKFCIQDLHAFTTKLSIEFRRRKKTKLTFFYEKMFKFFSSCTSHVRYKALWTALFWQAAAH